MSSNNKNLSELYHPYTMGETAENVAKQWNISREAQDEFALQSQEKYFKALAENKWNDEIVAVDIIENKATISFRLTDQVGALSKVLKIIVDNEVNLTKIQSLPVFGKAAEYRFHVDCEWNDYAKFKKSIAINSIVEDLKILGEYKKGEFVNDYSRSK